MAHHIARFFRILILFANRPAASETTPEAALRRFELALLTQLGYIS